MKKLLLLPILTMLSTASVAATVHVSIPNYDSYGQGMICVVDAAFNAKFSNLIHANDFAASRKDKNSALKLMSFFKDLDENACYRPNGTAQQVDVPNLSTVYVVTIVMKATNGTATDVYWNVTNLDTSGGIEQHVTVDAPKL